MPSNVSSGVSPWREESVVAEEDGASERSKC